MFRAPGPGDIGYGPHCPQFDSDGPDDEKMTPVSYTHLDVYKRQHIRFPVGMMTSANVSP